MSRQRLFDWSISCQLASPFSSPFPMKLLCLAVFAAMCATAAVAEEVCLCLCPRGVLSCAACESVAVRLFFILCLFVSLIGVWDSCLHPQTPWLVEFTVQVSKDTTGTFTMEVHPSWAPLVRCPSCFCGRESHRTRATSTVCGLFTCRCPPPPGRRAVQGLGGERIFRRRAVFPRHLRLYGAVWDQRQPRNLGVLAQPKAQGRPRCGESEHRSHASNARARARVCVCAPALLT